MRRSLFTAFLLALITACSASCPSTPAAHTVEPRLPAGMGTLVLGEASGDVWLLGGGEAPILLTHGEHPLISPDGCWVLVGRDQAEYWLVSIDGPGERRLFSPRDGWGDLVYDMVWAPDSSALLVTTGSSIKRLPSADLNRIDVPGGSVATLATHDAGDPYCSPDGRWVATSLLWTGYNQGAIGLVEADGTSQRLLFSSLLSQSLVWTADSDALAIALVHLEAPQQGAWELWWAPVGGEPVRRGTLSNAKSLSWAPGGRRLVYQGTEDELLHLASRDGSEDILVSKSTGMAPWQGAWNDLHGASPWSPDGRWLLVSRIIGNEPPIHYLANVDRLTEFQSLDVDWIHGWLDVSSFLATRTAGSSPGVYRCALDGDCQLLVGPFEFEGASYSPARCSH